MDHDGLQDFVNYLETERGFSAHTVKAYLQDIDQYGAYLVKGPAAFSGKEDEKPIKVIPKTLAGLGVENPDIERIVTGALSDPSTGGNPIEMTRENTTKLLLACL